MHLVICVCSQVQWDVENFCRYEIEICGIASTVHRHLIDPDVREKVGGQIR
jgi:hypothetical protein